MLHCCFARCWVDCVTLLEVLNDFNSGIEQEESFMNQKERGAWNCKFRLEKRRGDINAYVSAEGRAAFLDVVKPYEVIEGEDNCLLNTGIDEMWDLITGVVSGANHIFDNAAAQIGVGNGGLSALTGTITFTNGSVTVTGSGSSFTVEVTAGDKIQLDADGTLVGVASVETDTSLTLSNLYNDTGGGGAASLISPTETDLAGGSKTYKEMEGGFPTSNAQKVTMKSSFGSADANYAWEEWVIKQSTSAKCINRKVSSMGTKASGSTWTLEVTITLS